MARRATILGEQRKLDPRLLLLSGGDFSGEPGILEIYRSRFLAETMVAMGYQAVAVGERDLNFALRTLEAEAEGGLPVICANLYRGADRLFPPAIMKKIGGVKVGVFALLGEKPRELAGLELRDPVEEGRAVLETLLERCDYVILLAHMERGKLLEILPKLEGVDLVIRAHATGGESSRENCADTLGATTENQGLPVLSAGDRGMYVARVTLAPGPGGEPIIAESDLIRLNGAVADDSVYAERLKKFRVEEDVRRKEIEIRKNLARDETTGKLLERYLGIEICRRCHGDLMVRFVGSRHFRAFETLRRSGASDNPECFACHTTGFGMNGGYDPEREKQGAPYLLGVQCEACHGPATKHARDGSYVKSARESCRRCHTSKWSPDFDFDAYRRRANHCGGAE